MKTLFIVALFSVGALAAPENSILYPKQIQPKKKRSAAEEILDRQAGIEERQQEILDEQRAIRQESQDRYDHEMLLRSFDELTGR